MLGFREQNKLTKTTKPIPGKSKWIVLAIGLLRQFISIQIFLLRLLQLTLPIRARTGAGGSFNEDLNILKRKNGSDAGFQYCSSDTFTYMIKQLVDMDHMELRYTDKDK